MSTPKTVHRSLQGSRVLTRPYSDYDVFLSPLADFKKAIEDAGLSNKVLYLDRKDQYKFQVKQ